jgi:hypothetical protein
MLGCSPETENQAISSLLPFVRRELAAPAHDSRFPARRSQAALEAAGFFIQQTMIWMSTKLNRENAALDRST